MINQDQGESPAATSSLDATQFDPHSALITFCQAELLRKSGQNDHATVHYERCLKGTAYQAYALQCPALIAIGNPDWERARARLLAATQAEAGVASVFRLLATIEVKLGNAGRSKLFSEIALSHGRQRNPPDPWLHEVNAHCFDSSRSTVLEGTLRAACRNDETAALLGRVCLVDPLNAGVHYDLVMALGSNAAVLAERTDALIHAIKLDPNLINAYFELRWPRAIPVTSIGPWRLSKRACRKIPRRQHCVA